MRKFLKTKKRVYCITLTAEQWNIGNRKAPLPAIMWVNRSAGRIAWWAVELVWWSWAVRFNVSVLKERKQ